MIISSRQISDQYQTFERRYYICTLSVLRTHTKKNEHTLLSLGANGQKRKKKKRSSIGLTNYIL